MTDFPKFAFRVTHQIKPINYGNVLNPGPHANFFYPVYEHLRTVEVFCYSAYASPQFEKLFKQGIIFNEDSPEITIQRSLNMDWASSCPIRPDITISIDRNSYSHILLAALDLVRQNNNKDRILIQPQGVNCDTTLIEIWAKEETND